MTKATTGLLGLIEQAYEVGEGRDVTHEVFVEATTYLDEGLADGMLSEAERARQSEGIARHASRIERLFGMSGAAPGGVMAAAGAALEPAAHPVALLDRNGRILSSNAAFEALMPGPPTHLRGLPFEVAGLDRVLNALRTGARADIHLLTDSQNGTPTLAVLEPLAATARLRLARFQWTAETVARFARPFDIPPRELEVLHGALTGESQAAIAARLGRSPETIRSQSKSLLLRTGVARMSDLVLLGHSAALVGLPPEADASPEPRPDADLCRIERDGRTIAYRCFGPADGTPMLFFHGLMLGPFLTPPLTEGLDRIGVRLIAPSRPGFGETTRTPRDRDFDAAVVEDALAVLNVEGVDRCIVVAHQGGVSHAFRTAARLGDRLEGMLMIGAGVPIDIDEHVSKMNAVTRMAALAARRMPSLLDMLIRIGVHTYTRDEDGPRRYLEYYWRDDPIDLASLDDPVKFAAIRAGALHMITQEGRTILRDGVAAMADWTADFEAVRCRQLWIHGAHCPVMNAEALERWVRARTNHPVEISEGSGFHMIYDEPDRIIDALARVADWMRAPDS